jgi:glutamyl/glutaminyl-tRNA synthetase
MAASKDFNQVFEQLLSRYIKTIENDYRQRYKKARDKELVKEDLIKITDLTIEWATINEQRAAMMKVFHADYGRGEDIGETLAHIRKTFGEEVNDIRPFKRIENGKRITLYISEEEKALKAFALNERKLFKYLLRDTAYREIKKRLPDMFTEQTITLVEENSKAFPFKWTSTKDNKNEFVQLVYGLFKAKLINNGEGEITKITESLAKTFKVDLSPNWQANLSSSIHKSNVGYNPQVFDKINKAYQEYVNTLIENKKKNK